MRKVMLAIAFCLFATHALAQGGNGGQHVFGSINCKPRYSCSDVNLTPFSTLDKDANACVLNYFGYGQPDGLFEDTGSLDDNSCMTAKANVIPKGMGSQLTPQCCVIQQDDGKCGFHCNLVTVQSQSPAAPGH